LQSYDNTCGFWVITFALFTILGINFGRIPTHATEIKNIISSLWKEYQMSDDGGLSRQLVLSLFDPFDRNIRTRLGNGRQDLVGCLACFGFCNDITPLQWAPRRSDLNIGSSVYHGKGSTFMYVRH
jgi:hypothetical protein